MTQVLFHASLNDFARKYFVAQEGVAPPSADEVRYFGKIQETEIFENLLLFDRICIKIKGESIPIAVLIGMFGLKTFEALLEQNALQFVLWNQDIVHLLQNIPGIDGLGVVKFSVPEYTDPEKSIETGLEWQQQAPRGRKRRNLVRRLIPLFMLPEANLMARALKSVNSAIGVGGLEHYGIPKIDGPKDDLSTPQKRVVGLIPVAC